jgi:hypothetical protein
MSAVSLAPERSNVSAPSNGPDVSGRKRSRGRLRGCGQKDTATRSAIGYSLTCRPDEVIRITEELSEWEGSLVADLATYLTEPLRWARANSWRPLFPRTRRDGLHTWVNPPRVEGSRRYPPGTLKVSVDVAGSVYVQRMTVDGWVADLMCRVSCQRAVVDILAALDILPHQFSTAHPSGLYGANWTVVAVHIGRDL